MVSYATLTNNLNKLRGLSVRERRLLFQAVLLLPGIQVTLSLMGFERLRRLLETLVSFKKIEPALTEAEILGRAREITRMVAIAAEHGFYRATCLRRSILVWYFLREQGVQSVIRFGVRMNEHQLEAHAWVEYHGQVLNDSPQIHERYTALQEALPPTRIGL